MSWRRALRSSRGRSDTMNHAIVFLPRSSRRCRHPFLAWIRTWNRPRSGRIFTMPWPVRSATGSTRYCPARITPDSRCAKNWASLKKGEQGPGSYRDVTVVRPLRRTTGPESEVSVLVLPRREISTSVEVGPPGKVPPCLCRDPRLFPGPQADHAHRDSQPFKQAARSRP